VFLHNFTIAFVFTDLLAAAAVLAEAHAKQQAEVEHKLAATNSTTAEQQSASGTADTSTVQPTDANNSTAATGNAEKQQASTATPGADADAAGLSYGVDSDLYLLRSILHASGVLYLVACCRCVDWADK
jgi:hypothetical protein